MDTVDKKTRSEMMSRIRSKDTKPERVVRSLLHRMGLRFRLHQRVEGCKPDIVLAKHKTAIFVHGCFWHRHKGCRFAYVPKSRTEFWMTKFKANTVRDEKNERELNDAGWRVLIVWECEIRNLERLEAKLCQAFGTRR